MNRELFLDKKSGKNSYKGRRRKQTGTISIAMGILSFVILAALVFVSAGDDPTKYGNLGMLAFLDLLLSIGGMVLSIKWVKESINYGKSFVGLVINAAMFIILICIYLMGI